MKKNLLFLLASATLAFSCSAPVHDPNALRAPAYPLVTIDPYTNVWSAADNLYDKNTTHWTGAEFPLVGIIDVDGTEYRFMGGDEHFEMIYLPMVIDEVWTSSFTKTKPASNWYKAEFDASAWTAATGAYGRLSEKRNVLNEWTEGQIWVRRPFTLASLPSGKELNLRLGGPWVKEVYVNDQKVEVNKESHITTICADLLKEGENLIAVSAVQPEGRVNTLDFSISEKVTVPAACTTTAIQTLADVQATQTYYAFDCGPVELKLIFSAPLYDLKNLDLVSRPVNFITYETASKDGAKHEVSVSITASDRWAVNSKYQKTQTESFEKDGLAYVKAGSVEQKILGKRGDDLRIDWGYFYLAAPEADAEGMTVSQNKPAGHFLIGYDDIYSIQYFETNLRPYWNRNEDKTIFDMFNEAEATYKQDMKACTKFDAQLMEECTAAGGRKYAELCALAYRQTICAHKLVQLPNGEVDFFSKENNSNGSIGTVDVTYPSSPVYLRYNPTLSEGLMNHIYDYSESGRWTKPFPAHDVGTYPLANGQTYGGDMPVEESGNMVIQTAATCAAKKDFSYAQKHWDCLTTWTQYLEEYGLDPENQLCTDDFAGHFARNANLSMKAIMGVACYGYMAGKLGDEATEAAYMEKARQMAAKWMEMDDKGDHYGLVFEAEENTWSQKYNMVWDKIFGFNIFPEEVALKELKYYPTVFNQYGLPLDNRKTYTKSDWITWTANLAQTNEEFSTYIEPMWNFYNETVDRVPMSDWYYTDSQKYRGFIARSVVGGYFIRLLDYTK